MGIEQARSPPQIRFEVRDLLQDTLPVGRGKAILQLDRLIIIFTYARCSLCPNEIIRE
jgi:hypothetical protein